MYVGILVRRMYVTYSGDVQFGDLTDVFGNTAKEGVGTCNLQWRCPV